MEEKKCFTEKLDLLTNGDYIEKLAPTGKIKSSEYDEEINCKDFFISPGLIDAHNHLGLEPGDEYAQMQEKDAMIALRAAKNAGVDLLSGVTSMRTLGEKNYIDLEYKRAFAEGMLLGPKITVSGPALVATGGVGWYMHQEVDGTEEIRKAVRQRLKAGVDTIKVMVTGGISDRDTDPTRCYFSQEELNVLVDEAHEAGKPTSAHIYGGVGCYRAIEAGIDAIEHGFLFTDDMLEKMAEKMITLVITPSILSSNPSEGPEWRRLRLAAIQKRYLQVLHKAKELKITMAIGSDCNHSPYFFNNLLCELKNYGMKPEDILISATLNGAKVSGLGDTGQIVPGKKADLIVLKANPLEKIEALREVALVVKEGKVISRRA
jgi:imidazolonepropionase-like amidohydrolase